VTRHCDHGELEILGIIPAHGAGLACLYDPESDDPELEVTPIVGWAHVRRETTHCDCSQTAVVPLTAGWTTLEANDENAEADKVDCRIVGPGQRPVLRRDANGRCRIHLLPGTWTPGAQEIADLPARRKAS